MERRQIAIRGGVITVFFGVMGPAVLTKIRPEVDAFTAFALVWLGIGIGAVAGAMLGTRSAASPRKPVTRGNAALTAGFVLVGSAVGIAVARNVQFGGEDVVVAVGLIAAALVFAFFTTYTWFKRRPIVPEPDSDERHAPGNSLKP